MNKRIYIAGPLFSQGELEFNQAVNYHLKRLGFKTFLPQENGHKMSELINNGQKSEAVDTIFKTDIEEIEKSDILLFIMDGRVPDEGACVELGIAHALNKYCIGLKTDPRSLMHNMDNPLILGALGGKIANSISELEQFFIREQILPYNDQGERKPIAAIKH